MDGIIVKGIAGFYYIQTEEYGLVECKAKGVFRKEQIKPLVGDFVVITILDHVLKKGIIDEIKPRKNTLIRPAVANVDQALVVFAITKPAPNYNLLDRFLIMMEQLEIPVVICFNKMDLVSNEEMEQVYEIYKNANCKVIFSSTKEEKGLGKLKDALAHKITTIAGPSGVGKSSLINLLQSEIQMETGEISTKIDRGKHTTRHSELLMIDESSFIMDTPGFSSLGLIELEKEDLSRYYSEFEEYESMCKFQGCTHTHEPSCRVKDAVAVGEISQVRYDNYVLLYKELKDKRRH